MLYLPIIEQDQLSQPLSLPLFTIARDILFKYYESLCDRFLKIPYRFYDYS